MYFINLVQEQGSSSNLSGFLGFRARSLRWCIHLDAVLSPRAYCSRIVPSGDSFFRYYRDLCMHKYAIDEMTPPFFLLTVQRHPIDRMSEPPGLHRLTPSRLRRTRHSTYARPTPPTAQRGPLQRVFGVGVHVFMTVGSDVTVKNTPVSANVSTLGAMIHHPALQGLSRQTGHGLAPIRPASRPRPPKVLQVDGPYQGKGLINDSLRTTGELCSKRL